MPSPTRISEAEWEVMEILWKSPGLSASEVFDRLGSEKAWAMNTVRTLIDRLAGKKVIRISRKAGVKTFEPAVAREACVHQESESFLSRVFGGSKAPLIMHFVKQADLSPEELRELRRLLKEKAAL